MTVFAEFKHPRNGSLYIDPRDITGFRTNLAPNEVATPGKTLVVIMRSGANEEIVGLSMDQVIDLRGLMSALEKAAPDTRFIPADRLMAALATTGPTQAHTPASSTGRPTLHLNNRRPA